MFESEFEFEEEIDQTRYEKLVVEIKDITLQTLPLLLNQLRAPGIVARSDDIFKVMTAVEIIGKLGEPAIDTLIVLLREGDVEIKFASILALIEMKAQKALPALVEIIGRGTFFISYEAAKAVDRIGGAAVLDALLELAAHENPDVRACAILAIGRIRERKVIEILMTTLTSDLNAQARAETAKHLGHLELAGEKYADADREVIVDALIRALRQDISGEVRFWSAVALGQLGNEKALPHLQYASEHDNRGGTLGGYEPVNEAAKNSIEEILTRLKTT